MEEFREFIYNQHDIVCNQKYADTLPYSTHLKFVEAQGNKFLHLIDMEFMPSVNYALVAHDSIEDARMTYNDIVKLVSKFHPHISKTVADIVYCVTDEKGKTRSERKNAKYYQELKANKLALFVKLADLAANTLYSKLSASDMYDKYKKEWPAFKNKLYLAEYDEFFNYIDNI